MVFKDLLQASEKKNMETYDHRLESFDPNVKVILEQTNTADNLSKHVFIFKGFLTEVK